jgi:hypothetical protein
MRFRTSRASPATDLHAAVALGRGSWCDDIAGGGAEEGKGYAGVARIEESMDSSDLPLAGSV